MVDDHRRLPSRNIRAVVTACARLVKTQGRQILAQRKADEHEAPSTGKALLVWENHWQNKS